MYVPAIMAFAVDDTLFFSFSFFFSAKIFEKKNYIYKAFCSLSYLRFFFHD